MLVLVGAGIGCASPLPEPGTLPPGRGFAGPWDSNWGQMRLSVEGNHVHGPYRGFRNGSVSGEQKGNLFVFRWTDVGGVQSGRGYLQMNAEGDRIEGKWGYQKSYDDGGRWWAARGTE